MIPTISPTNIPSQNPTKTPTITPSITPTSSPINPDENLALTGEAVVDDSTGLTETKIQNEPKKFAKAIYDVMAQEGSVYWPGKYGNYLPVKILTVCEGKTTTELVCLFFQVNGDDITGITSRRLRRKLLAMVTVDFKVEAWEQNEHDHIRTSLNPQNLSSNLTMQYNLTCQCCKICLENDLSVFHFLKKNLVLLLI